VQGLVLAGEVEHGDGSDGWSGVNGRDGGVLHGDILAAGFGRIR